MKKELLFVLLAVLSSCNMIKTIHLFKKGSLEQKVFKETIPFSFEAGMIIIPVVINGKTYRFLMDTGAPNLISKELATELNLKAKVSQKVMDSQGNSVNQDFIVLPDLRIGSLNFKKMGAVVFDINESGLKCKNIDGFIGANLMRQAIWELDFDKKVVSISDKRSVFEVNQNATIMSFKPEMTGTPKIEINFDGVLQENVTFDTGSDGGFTSSTEIYHALSKQSKDRKRLISYGSASSGLYGAGSTDSSYTLVLDSIKLGNLYFNQERVDFEKGAKFLGTKFLKNYRVILDWDKNEIVLNQLINGEKHEVSVLSFGVSPTFKEGKLFISDIVYGSDADEKGMKLGDQILEVNGVDYRNCTEDMWCQISERKLFSEELQMATIVFKQGEEEKLVVLYKRDLLR